jgi:hypothetical protein
VRVYASTEETVVARGRTGEDGVYRFRSGALTDGTYRVVFSDDHWWQNGTSWDTAADVTLSAGQATTLDVALVPETTVIYGETSHQGGPSPGVRVDVFHADTGDLVATALSEEWPPSPDHPCGNSTGCYTVEVPAGDLYTLRASYTSTAWYWHAGGPANGFGLETMQGDQAVPFSLSPATAVTGFLGRVVDGDGNPIAGAEVFARPSRDPVPPKLHSASTGGDGTFVMSEIASGYYHLLLVGPDGVVTFAGMTGGDPDTATEFYAAVGLPSDVGDITLSAP